jgi:hypothetical protein
LLAVYEAATFTDEHFMAFGAGDFHIGLIGAQMSFIAPRAKSPAAGLADQGLFTKAAFDHVRFPPYDGLAPRLLSYPSPTGQRANIPKKKTK